MQIIERMTMDTISLRNLKKRKRKALRIGSRSINAAAVSLEDQRYDHVYRNEGKDRVFELAEKYDVRKAERQTKRPSALQALKEKSNVMMKFEKMRGASMRAYANALGICSDNGKGGMPAFSTSGTLRETMDQMGDQEYMISVEIGGTDEFEESV